MKRMTAKARTAWILLLACFAWTSIASQADAKRKYTKGQLPGIIAKAVKDLVAKTIKVDPKLKKLRKTSRKLEAKLKKGACTKAKHPKTKKLTTYCFRKILVGPAFFANDKRATIFIVPAGTQKKLRKEYKSIRKKVVSQRKKIDKKKAARRKQLIKERRKKFFKALKTLRKKAPAKAKAFFKSRKGKIAKKIAMIAAKKIKEAMRVLKPMLKSKLNGTLRKTQNPKHLKAIMQGNKAVNVLSKGFAKMAAIAVAKIVALQAATSVYNCWVYTGERKRTCFKKELTRLYRDTIFQITAKLIALVIDVSVIEPMSHSAAGAVSGALAAATAGVGAAAYPVVYVICSVSANVSVSLIFSELLQPQYNKLYGKIAPKIDSFNAKLVKGIPKKYLVCVGGNKICKRKCPYGAFEGTKGKCWKCPSGYTHNKKKKHASKPCQKRVHKKAKFIRKRKKKRCKKPTFFDLRKGGECWQCPKGFKRTIHAVTHKKACKGWRRIKGQKAGMPK